MERTAHLYATGILNGQLAGTGNGSFFNANRQKTLFRFQVLIYLLLLVFS